MATPTLDDLIRLSDALDRARSAKTVIDEIFNQGLITEAERTAVLERLRTKVLNAVDTLCDAIGEAI